MTKQNDTTFDLRSQFCPACFTMVECATNMTGADAPKPGDAVVCLYCAAVLEFDGNMMLRVISLFDIPMHSRFDFAKAVRLVKERIAQKEKEKWKVKPPVIS